MRLGFFKYWVLGLGDFIGYLIVRGYRGGETVFIYFERRGISVMFLSRVD